MNPSSTLSSKGQITVPQEIRKRLGVAAGDRVEFVVENDQTVIRPVRSEPNPFKKYKGIAPFPGGLQGIRDWIADMRDDDRD